MSTVPESVSSPAASASPASSGISGGGGGDRNSVVPIRHYGRGVGAVLVVALVALFIYSMATNPNISWQVVGDFLFNGQILDGLLATAEMTVLALVISLIGAVIVAVMRMSKSRIISWVAATYVFVFRSIPPMLLLIFLGNLGLFVKKITIGIPFTDITFYSGPTSRLITPFIASVIGLSLAGIGYMGEIVRGGLLSIGRGQHEAAKALGLRSRQTMRHIILPQGLRVILPPLGNELIGMLKATAMVAVIGGGDLLTIAQGISGQNYRTIELLIVATTWYFIVIAVISVGQHFIEKRFAEK